MSEWVTIGDLMDIVPDKAVLKPSDAKYIGLEQIEGGASGRLLGVLPGSASTSVNGVFTADDILWGKLRPNLMKATQVGFNGYCSTDILILRAQESVHPRFAAWSTCNQRVFNHAVAKTEGTKMPRASWEILRAVPARKPPLDEQRRIAAILDASEATIRATEAVIEKLRLDLVGLRTEIFAANQVWTTCLFGEAVRSFIDYRGRTPKKLGMSWGGGEIPALSAMNVSMGKIDLSKETYYGTDALYRRWMTNGDAEQGDVLLTMEAPLGNVAQIPDVRKYILSQRVLLIKFDGQRFNNDFMRQLMTDYQFQSAMLKWSTGTTAVGIQRARLVLIPVRTPALAEQVKLAATLLAHEHRITAGEEELAKLRLQHQGLLHDLITGTVRTHA